MSACASEKEGEKKSIFIAGDEIYRIKCPLQKFEIISSYLHMIFFLFV